MVRAVVVVVTRYVGGWLRRVEDSLSVVRALDDANARVDAANADVEHRVETTVEHERLRLLVHSTQSFDLPVVEGGERRRCVLQVPDQVDLAGDWQNVALRNELLWERSQRGNVGAIDQVHPLVNGNSIPGKLIR